MELQKGFTGLEVIIVVAIVGMLGTGTAVVVDDAKPGDFLYELDLALEDFQDSFVTDPVDKFELSIERTKERLEELGQVEDAHDDSAESDEHIEEALRRSSESLKRAQDVVIDVSEDEGFSLNELERVPALLAELDQTQSEREAVVTRLRQEVEDGEVKTRIELEDGETTRVVRIETKEEDDGSTKERLKVYEIDEKGVEIKVTDIETHSSDSSEKSLDSNDSDDHDDDNDGDNDDHDDDKGDSSEKSSDSDDSDDNGDDNDGDNEEDEDDSLNLRIVGIVEGLFSRK